MTPSPNTAAYTEEPALYVAIVVLTALQAVQRIPVNIDRDSEFCLTGINGLSTGAYTINFRLPSGRLISSAQINSTAFISATGNQPTSIGPPQVYRANSSGPELDLTDLSNAGNTITLVFSGIRRLKVGNAS